MARILITGSNGFIAKNLISRLKNENHMLYFHNRNESIENLKEALLNSEIIFHFAGVNKPKNTTDFKKINIDLTKYILDFITKNELKIKFIFSSSTQAELNNNYGLSKLEAENHIIDFSKKTNNQVVIFRLNGIFGKWSKPDYNSVVSTFCYRIINSLPIHIDSPLKKLSLTYIDDLVNDFIKVLHSNSNKKIFYTNPSSIYKITVEKIAQIIKGFDLDRKNFKSENVGSGIKRKLYATYLTYLPKKSFAYNLVENNDNRGKFVEILKMKNNGQLSFITIKPKQSRGNHYHHTKSEKFIVLKGEVKFIFLNILTKESEVFYLSGINSQVIESIPGWNHELINQSNDEAIVVVWANEIYKPLKHDTYQII